MTQAATKTMNKYNAETKIHLDPLEYDLLIQHVINLHTNLVELEITLFPLQISQKIRKIKHAVLRVSTQINIMEIMCKPLDS